MVTDEVRRFFHDNPLLYGHAPPGELDQLARILELYPDVARLLTDSEAVELPVFECRRCGRCCTSVKYITVCHEDVKRWVRARRLDILDSLVIDRRRTPLLARCREAVAAVKAEARITLERSGLDDAHIFQLLYVTGLLECAVYLKRRAGACAFLDEGGTTCTIHDTKPLVCGKFPYYMGRYTDGRLLKEDGFCPALGTLAKDRNKKE